MRRVQEEISLMSRGLLKIKGDCDEALEQRGVAKKAKSSSA